MGSACARYVSSGRPLRNASSDPSFGRRQRAMHPSPKSRSAPTGFLRAATTIRAIDDRPERTPHRSQRSHTFEVLISARAPAQGTVRFSEKTSSTATPMSPPRRGLDALRIRLAGPSRSVQFGRLDQRDSLDALKLLWPRRSLASTPPSPRKGASRLGRHRSPARCGRYGRGE